MGSTRVQLAPTMGSTLLQRLASSHTRRGENACAAYLAAGSYSQAGRELAPQSLAHYLRVARRYRSVRVQLAPSMGSTLLQRLASSPTRRGENACAGYPLTQSLTKLAWNWKAPKTFLVPQPTWHVQHFNNLCIAITNMIRLEKLW